MEPQTAQDLIDLGFGGYQGWPDTEAIANFKATGGEGKKTGVATDGNGADAWADQLVGSQEAYWNKQSSFVEKYLKDNPFAFDEVLAKESAKTEFEPYYDELLEDYLEDVGIARETIQKEEGLLTALKTTPEGLAGEATRKYERAIAQAEEGFAGRGMFFSGTRKTKLGQAEVERGYGLKSAATEVTRQSRDIGREKETAIAGGVEQRRGEVTKGYWSPLVQSYQRQFPSTQSGVLSGYLPENYLRL